MPLVASALSPVGEGLLQLLIPNAVAAALFSFRQSDAYEACFISETGVSAGTPKS